MKTEFTPGPWANEYPFITAGTAPIARIDCTPEMDKYDEANARLIAASPELLAALQFMLTCANAEGWSDYMTAPARASIAKAMGGAAQ